MGAKPRHIFGRYRRIKDSVAKYTIVAGGVFVLITLLLIFCYLLYVTFPVLQSAQVTTKDSIKLPQSSSVLVDDAGQLVIAQSDQSILASSPSTTSSATVFSNAVLASSNSVLILQPRASHWRIHQVKASPQTDPSVPVDLHAVISKGNSRVVEFDGHIQQQQQLASVLLYNKQFEYFNYDISNKKLNRHQLIDLPVSGSRILLNHRLDKITVLADQRLLVYQITSNSIGLLYDIQLAEFNSAKVVDIAS